MINKIRATSRNRCSLDLYLGGHLGEGGQLGLRSNLSMPLLGFIVKDIVHAIGQIWDYYLRAIQRKVSSPIVSLLLSLDEMWIGVEWYGANIIFFPILSPRSADFLFSGILLEG